MRLKHSSLSRQQRGITLIESLVAIVVAALGILGILGAQMRTLSDTQTTMRRAQAIRLIEDLSERMRVNPNALANIANYQSDFSSEPTPSDCSSSSCNHSQLASHDLAHWKQSVKNTLPLGQASIFLAPAEGAGSNPNRRQLGVMISWRENERDTSASYKNSIDNTQISEPDGSFKAGGGTTASCPADRTCHLQYLALAARCAPYSSSGSTQFFCSGS